MTVSGIDPTSGLQAQYGSQSPLQQVMGAVSNELGMSQDDVRTALRSGSSLADLATQKGISGDQLTSTISQALQSNGTSSADTTALANRIANHKGGGHHHHHHHAQAPPTPNPLDPGTTLNEYA